MGQGDIFAHSPFVLAHESQGESEEETEEEEEEMQDKETASKGRYPNIGKGRGKSKDKNDGSDGEVLEDDEREIRFTRGLLKELMTDIVGDALSRAGRASPSKHQTGKVKRLRALKDEKALDAEWERRNYCVSNDFMLSTLIHATNN